MIRLYVRHPVEDFATWMAGYAGDESVQRRRDGGVTGQAVYQAVDDPNDVTVWHDFGSLDEARAFVEQPWLREVMEEIGVIGEPTVWLTRPA